MSTAPTTGDTARITVQPPVQPPAPDAPPPGARPGEGAPPSSPQLRNLSPGSDPRGRKRDREDSNADNREPSTEPLLKQARTEPSAPPQPPEIAIFHAIDAGDITTLQSLLSRYPALINEKYLDDDGETLLCRAARHGQRDIVNLLLQMGAEVDARASNGATPLMFAAQAGQTEVIRQLHRKGADVNAVHVAFYDHSALFYAANANQLEACKCLVELGANLSAKSSAGDICLLPAVAANSLDVVQWLLQQRISIDEPNNTGNTALMCACMAGHLAMVRLLVARGADLAAKDTEGNTCLAWAVIQNHSEVVNWLLKQGVPPDKPNVHGVTPIVRAFFGRNWGIVDSLLQYGVDNFFDRSRSTTSLRIIAEAAAMDGQYQVLISLKQRYGVELFPGDCLLFLDRAAILDLYQNYDYLQSGESLAAEDWLSDSAKPDRQEFALRCTQVWARRELLDIKKSALSYVINAFLELDLGNRKFDLLSTALAGKGNVVPLAQGQNMILFVLKSLKNSSRLAEVFSSKCLSPEQATRMNEVLARGLDSLLLSLTEVLPLEQSDFIAQLTRLCEKYLKITGRFDSKAFSKALCKHFGLYRVNADRLTVLVGKALDAARRKPLGVATAEDVGQTVQLIGQQLMDSLSDELRTTIADSSDDPTLPGFTQGLEMVMKTPITLRVPSFGQFTENDSEVDLEQDLQAVFDIEKNQTEYALELARAGAQEALGQPEQPLQLIQPEAQQLEEATKYKLIENMKILVETRRLEHLTLGLLTQQQLHQLNPPEEPYADMIFGQWRQISKAFGVVLPEWRPSGQ